MPDSTYDRIRKQECEWCAKGNIPTVSNDTVHKVYSMESSAPLWQRDESIKGLSQYFRCTAPSRDAVIDRQAEEIRGLREDMRLLANGSKTLVRAGCLGCLTDDCEHWGNGCRVDEMTLCRIGRSI